MADNGGAILASLLQGQRMYGSPLQQQRLAGQNLIVKGSSTAPLGSGNPLEGLARALQAGIGGLEVGNADRRYADQAASTQQGLTNASLATTPEGFATAMQGIKGDPDTVVPILGQIAQTRLNNLLLQQQAGAAYGALTGERPASQGSGPFPAQAPGAAPTPAPPNPNNVGNITDGQGGFTQPPTPQAGTADLTKLLQAYPIVHNGGQPMTLQQIASRYAPADNGQDPMLRGNNPAAWANNVAQIAGVRPDQPLDFDNPAVVTAVSRGINAQEKGPQNAQPPGVIQQGVAQGMDPAAFGQSQGAPQPPLGAGTGVAPGAPQAPPQQAAQGPPQPPTPTQSPAGNMYRQQAAQAHAQGRNDVALAFAQKAIEADAGFMQDVAKRDVPGTPAGDVALLQSGMHDPRVVQTPEYAAALARANKPQMAQGGQLYFPDTTAYPVPGGAPPSASGGRFQDTPDSSFKIEQALGNQFSKDPAVAKYLKAKPIFDAMENVKSNPSKATDTALGMGVASILVPGSDRMPPPDIIKKLTEVESIPASIKTALNGALSGNGMDEKSRQILLDIAQSNLGPMKNEYDARVRQYSKMARDYGVNPDHVLTTPAEAPQAAPAAIRTYNPATGKIE